MHSVHPDLRMHTVQDLIMRLIHLEMFLLIADLTQHHLRSAQYLPHSLPFFSSSPDQPSIPKLPLFLHRPHPSVVRLRRALGLLQEGWYYLKYLHRISRHPGGSDNNETTLALRVNNQPRFHVHHCVPAGWQGWSGIQ